MAAERRRSKRTSMPSTLTIKKLGGNMRGNTVTVNVLNVSKTGVGFSCDEALQIGDVYESFMPIWTKEVLHVIMQIVRIELIGETYTYGALFIGMPEIDMARIEVYQTVNESQN